MEPRSCLVAYDAATESYRIHSPMQGVTTLRSALGLYAWHGKHHVAHVTELRTKMGW